MPGRGNVSEMDKYQVQATLGSVGGGPVVEFGAQALEQENKWMYCFLLAL